MCYQAEEESFWFGHRNDVIVELVRNFSPEAAFFDIGGGNGCVAGALQTAGMEVVLLEPGPVGAMNAKKRGIRTVIQSSLEDAGFAPNSLPSAGIFDVLEHIESDAAFLRTLHGYLKPKACLYLTVPAYGFLWSADDVQAGHFRRYTARSLNRLLAEAGFEVCYCGYIFSFLVPAIFFLRSLPSRMGFQASVSPATMKRDHSPPGGIVGSLVRACRTFELERVLCLKRIPLGSSCVAVARKAG